MTEIIETERLILRKIEESDCEFVYKLLNSPGWLKYIGDRGINNLEDAKIYIREKVVSLYDQHGYGPYGVRTKLNNSLIGFCGLFKRDFLEDADIGFAFLPEHSGKGYAIESAVAVLEYARDVIGLRRIIAITLEQNERSINVLNKLGMVFERKIQYPDGGEELIQFSIELKGGHS
jgi:RimJ/RimL family protein N-acetyltransferase